MNHQELTSRAKWRRSRHCGLVLGLLVLLAPMAAGAQSSGCDTYATAIKDMKLAEFQFHSDFRSVGEKATPYQFWVRPATGEWLLMELAPAPDGGGLTGCITMSGKDFRQFDIGLPMVKP